jgi:hypothetical protein
MRSAPAYFLCKEPQPEMVLSIWISDPATTKFHGAIFNKYCRLNAARNHYIAA